MVFLGDYVDRGDKSLETAEFLFKSKVKYPDSVILLAGNHDISAGEIYPSEFWDYLNEDETFEWKLKFMSLPLFVSMGNILAVHAALPDVKKLKYLESPDEGALKSAIWGDYGYERLLNADRPIYDRKWFNRTMKQVNKKMLIRGHQIGTDVDMYGDGRCITLITNRANQERRIAFIEKGVKPESMRDIRIINL